MPYCIHCGSKIPEVATFCSQCGKKQVDEGVKNAPIQPPPPMPRRGELQPVKVSQPMAHDLYPKTYVGATANYANTTPSKTNYKPLIIVCALMAILFIAWFSGSMAPKECTICGDSFVGTAYYTDTTRKDTCRECAQRFWYPFDIEQYKK